MCLGLLGTLRGLHWYVWWRRGWLINPSKEGKASTRRKGAGELARIGENFSWTYQYLEHAASPINANSLNWINLTFWNTHYIFLIFLLLLWDHEKFDMGQHFGVSGLLNHIRTLFTVYWRIYNQGNWYGRIEIHKRKGWDCKPVQDLWRTLWKHILIEMCTSLDVGIYSHGMMGWIHTDICMHIYYASIVHYIADIYRNTYRSIYRNNQDGRQ